MKKAAGHRISQARAPNFLQPGVLGGFRIAAVS